jgi:hypothetical protein
VVTGSADGTSGFALFDAVSGGNHIGSMTRQENGIDVASYDQISFKTGATSGISSGAERMRITSAGNVGIGTSSPGERLNVVGGGATSSTVNLTGGNGFDNATIASDYSLVFQVDANNNVGGREFNWRVGGKGYSDGTSLMLLNSAGNLGLGVTPSAWDSSGNAQFQKLTFAGNDYSLGSNYYQNLGAYRYASTDTAARLSFYNGQFQFLTAPSGTAGNAISFTQAMTLDASGNLGVGTTSPNGRLQVTDANRIFDSFGNLNVLTSDSATVGAGGAIGFGGNNATGGTSPYVFAKIQGIKEGATSTWNGALLFGTTAGSSAVTERMRITSAGNVGIGTSSPTFKLETMGEIKSSISDGDKTGITIGRVDTSRPKLEFNVGDNSARFKFEVNGANTSNERLGFFAGPIGSAATIEAMTLSGSGNVGIGTTSPAQKLDVAGSILASGNVTAYSDIRVKDNVESIEGAIGKLNQIRGVTYTRTDLDDKHRRFAGVIAQEIEQVLPEAVFDNGRVKAVDYNATIALLIEAVKEQQKRIDKLETLLNKGN